MSSWYLPAKKYAEISPSHNITFKSAAGVSHMQEGAIGKALAQRHGHFRVSTQRC